MGVAGDDLVAVADDLNDSESGTKLGRAAIDNPDLPVSFIAEALG